MYYSKFFATESDAKAFQKKQGYGVLYKNTPRSRTRSDYRTEALMRGHYPDSEFCKIHPYVVAWNG